MDPMRRRGKIGNHDKACKSKTSLPVTRLDHPLHINDSCAEHAISNSIKALHKDISAKTTKMVTGSGTTSSPDSKAGTSNEKDEDEDGSESDCSSSDKCDKEDDSDNEEDEDEEDEDEDEDDEEDEEDVDLNDVLDKAFTLIRKVKYSNSANMHFGS